MDNGFLVVNCRIQGSCIGYVQRYVTRYDTRYIIRYVTRYDKKFGT